jgi:hypothetical protein
VGPVGAEYYGFAYDHATLGGPFLWGYAQVGTLKNKIIQIQLPSGTETGFTLDIATKLTGQIYNSAGGLFTHPNLVFGKWTLGGLVQNQWIWGLELADAQTWININPNSGSLAGGTTQEVTVMVDAVGLLPGIYEAEIHFTSTPNVGVPIVQVELTVDEGTFFKDYEENEITIIVFPNPVKDILFVQSSKTITYVELISNSGQCVMKDFCNENTMELSMTSIIPGIYFLKIETLKGISIRKLVIE